MLLKTKIIFGIMTILVIVFLYKWFVKSANKLAESEGFAKGSKRTKQQKKEDRLHALQEGM